MPLTYAGITPTLLINTADLQDTEKLSRKAGRLVRNRNGVCMAMVLDWIQKSNELPGGVTDKSQLKSGLALSLAQTAYMRHVFDTDNNNDFGFIDSQGMSVNTFSEVRRKRGLKGLFQKNPLKQVSAACAGLIGFAVIGIYGDGGHALGYRQKNGIVQFFDPNEGILQFNSSQDFSKWFPAYVAGEYADLMESADLTKVRA